MEVKAVEKFIRMSPKKARLVADVVRGQNAKKSLVTLKFLPQKGAKIIFKALKSAVANAENNHNLNGDSLVISKITIDQGPSLKRFRPRSRGMVSHILKRTSHVTVVVTDEPIQASKAKTKISDKKAEVRTDVKTVKTPAKKVKEETKVDTNLEVKAEEAGE